MKVLKSTLRAIVERVTQLEWHHQGDKIRLFVFEHLDERGVPAEQWIQNWNCDDVTLNFTRTERDEIYQTLEEYYKCKAFVKE